MKVLKDFFFSLSLNVSYKFEFLLYLYTHNSEIKFLKNPVIQALSSVRIDNNLDKDYRDYFEFYGYGIINLNILEKKKLVKDLDMFVNNVYNKLNGCILQVDYFLYDFILTLWLYYKLDSYSFSINNV